MTEDRLHAAVEGYLRARALNIAPPTVVSDPLVDGETPTEQLLRVLGLAANSDDPADTGESADGHAQREAWTTSAAGAFAGQDGDAAGQVMSIAGTVGGIITGLATPLAQIPGQLSQNAQQAVQAATSLLAAVPGEDPMNEAADDSVLEPTDFSDPWVPVDGAHPGDNGLGGAGVATPADPTVPTAVLGPAPVASAPTYPSGSSILPPVQAGVAPPIGGPAMTGMPMIPPTGLPSTAAESKGDTKRIAAPVVRNGAPVHGRITTPATGPVVTTRIDGKPVATRRIRIDQAAADAEEPR